MWVRISGPAGIEGGNCEWTALSPPSIPWLRCPWARHRTPSCSPGAGAMAAHCSRCVFTVCVFTTHCCVCALGWVKCRAPISSMGHHTWQYITLFFLFFFYIHTYIRGGTVHRCHGSVRGSRFDMISVQHEKKRNLLCSVSFHFWTDSSANLKKKSI